MAASSPSDRLCTASARGDLEEVQLLLQSGAHVNGENRHRRTALQVVMLGHSELVEVLLKAGADLNVRDPVLSLTVTHDAAREGYIDSVRALVNHGADVNLVDQQGNLPLHLAARGGHLEVVKLMIGRTADPQTANGLGYTAGQLAQLHGWKDTATFIEEHLGSN